MTVQVNRRLLIIDDEQDIREILRDMCQFYLGAECHLAANGREALAAMKSFDPDAIVTDIQMPQMTGIELLAELRKQGRETPVVMLTAFADRKNTIEALRLGAIDFLEKPLEEQIIIEVLKKALNLGSQLKRMEKELNDFCASLKDVDQKKLQHYREAKKAVLMLRTEHSRIQTLQKTKKDPA